MGLALNAVMPQGASQQQTLFKPITMKRWIYKKKWNCLYVVVQFRHLVSFSFHWFKPFTMVHILILLAF